ncbi:S8 family serine peptidase, partial [Candidatus Woesearchaeota archaeon]|nr:S8 family serine peptidase [Candidatus Woesearchaeota archaeon]
MLLFIFSFLSNAKLEENNLKFDSKIINLLESDGKANVIVMLNDDSNIKITGSKKERLVKLTQRSEVFLNSQESIFTNFVENEFKLKNQFLVINGFSGEIDYVGFNKMKNNPKLKYIYLNEISYPELYESTQIIKAKDVWDLGVEGNGQTVCVIDTGVDYSHENLGDCSEAEFLSGNCDKVIGGYDYYYNDSNPMDEDGHGTGVAGIVAAEGSISGVAPEAKLVALKVCNEFGSCDTDAQIKAFEWCIFNSSKLNISVITMSLGGQTKYTSYCNSDPRAEVINTAIREGISVIKSSGNNGWTDGVTAPGCVENITVVGATDKNDNIWSGGNRWEFLDLLAPGVMITSANLGGGTLSGTGTSYSAPHVAGTVALLHEIDSASTPFEIEGKLKQTGESIYDSGSGFYFPRINVLNAFGAIDWPTFHHDNRRTGFTLLKGDISDESDVNQVNLVLQ